MYYNMIPVSYAYGPMNYGMQRPYNFNNPAGEPRNTQDMQQKGKNGHTQRPLRCHNMPG